MISRRGWYSIVDVQFELIHNHIHRETIFMPFRFSNGEMKSTPPIRNLNASYIGMMKRHWKKFKFLEYNMNIYHSLARFKDFPTFSYNWNLKAEQQEIWNQRFKDYIIGMDWFIETDSTDLSKSVGDAKKIKRLLDKYSVRYYKAFSLAGDTPILIKTNEQIRLIDIKDAVNYVNIAEVLTLDKNNEVTWKKITNFISHYDNLIDVFHRQGGKIPIQCTKDHSAFVLDENYNIIEKKGKDLCVGDFLITVNDKKRLIEDKTQEIIFDYVCRLPKKEKIIVSNELMWCLGAYLGDGSLQKNRIHLGKSNFELVKRFGSFFPKCGFNESYRGKYKTLLYASISSKKWRDFFDYACGHLAENKHLPPFIWQLSQDKIYSFLEGYIDTDGHKTDIHFVKIKSKSKTIIKELCWLLKIIGIPCRINSEISKDHPSPTGQNIKGCKIYMIAINKQELINKIPKYSKSHVKFSPKSIDNCLPTNIFKKLLTKIKPKILGGIKGNRPDGLIREKNMLSREFLMKYLDWIEKTNKNKTIEVNEIVKKIKDVIYSDVRITKITKINKGNILLPVFDISVEDTERFYTGNYPLLFQNSGSKGVHFNIPYEEVSHLPVKIYDEEIEKNVSDFKSFLSGLPVPLDKLRKYTDLVLIFKCLNTRLKLIYGIDTLDDSISDVRRIKKTPYSWDVKSGLIALPLTDEMLDNFNRDDMRPENVIKGRIHKRGLLYSNEMCCHIKRKLDFIQLLKDLDIVKN